MKKTITVLMCILLTMALAVPAFAGNPKKEITETVEFRVTDPSKDGEVQPQADVPLPILAYGRTHMSLISNHVSAYSETGCPYTLNLQTECYLKAQISGRWSLIDYSVDSSVGYISVATCAGKTYNSSYAYAADGYHRTYDPATGYVGSSWSKDTVF